MQVSFANALKCNPSNADAKARLAASERSIGRVRDDNTKLPSIDNPVRPAFEKARSKAFRPFSAHTREALSWAEADLRREQGQRQEQEHREPGEVQRQGAEARMKGAQAQKQEVESQEGVAAVALDAPAAAAAGAASSKRAAAADQGKPSTAVMAPLPAAAWSSWADGKGADKAAQWFIDCFRLRETDDWLGPNAHFHNDDCRKVATLPLLIFCKLAVRKKVVPPRWNWGIFFSKYGPSLNHGVHLPLCTCAYPCVPVSDRREVMGSTVCKLQYSAEVPTLSCAGASSAAPIVVLCHAVQCYSACLLCCSGVSTAAPSSRSSRS